MVFKIYVRFTHVGLLSFNIDIQMYNVLFFWWVHFDKITYKTSDVVQTYNIKLQIMDKYYCLSYTTDMI